MRQIADVGRRRKFRRRKLLADRLISWSQIDETCGISFGVDGALRWFVRIAEGGCPRRRRGHGTGRRCRQYFAS